MPWVYDPHRGGVKIPERIKERTRQRILAYAEKHYHGKYVRIEVRFRTQLCDIESSTDPFLAENSPPPQVARNAGRGAGTHAQAPTPTVPSSALGKRKKIIPPPCSRKHQK